MSEFTSGPWSVPHFADPRSTCECKYVLSGHHFGSIAIVNWSPDDSVENGCNPPLEEAKANARLIAAAPAMYAALAALVAKLPAIEEAVGPFMSMGHVHGMRYGGPNWNDELGSARAALSAAEGKGAEAKP